MKKTYIQPNSKSNNIKVRKHMLEGSPTSVGFTSTAGDNIQEVLSKDDEEYGW